jgi:ATP/maltotriose-dependent transcriptional regulator MalT
MKLDKGEITEVKEFYDGTNSSARELAKRFNVSLTCIRWHTNHKGFRQKQTERAKKWLKKHPEKAKEYNKRASLKWRQNNPEKVKLNCKRYQEILRKKIKIWKEFYEKMHRKTMLV